MVLPFTGVLLKEALYLLRQHFEEDVVTLLQHSLTSFYFSKLVECQQQRTLSLTSMKNHCSNHVDLELNCR
jgi:hypothetical protein